MKSERKTEFLWVTISIAVTEIAGFLTWYYLNWFEDGSVFIGIFFGLIAGYFVAKALSNWGNKCPIKYRNIKDILEKCSLSIIIFLVAAEVFAFLENYYFSFSDKSIFLVMLGLALFTPYIFRPKKRIVKQE